MGLVGVATAVVIGTVAATVAGSASAPADALPASFTASDVVASGVESALAHGEAVALREPAIGAASGCTKGVSAGPAVRSGNAVDQERRYYYDEACTTIARTVVIHREANGSTVTATTFDPAGERIAQRKTEYDIRRSGGDLSTRAASRVTAGTTNSVVALANAAWDESGDGRVSTSVARIGDPQTSSVGVAVAATGTERTAADGTREVSAQSSGPLFHGPAGGLAVTLSAPYQIMSAPQSRVGVESGRWSEAIDRGLPVRLSVHNASLSQGLRLDVTTQDGRIVGTISNAGGKTLARMNVDRFGNGSVSYANGDSAGIADWHCTTAAAV